MQSIRIKKTILLSVPFITHSVDLIRKFSQIFISAALIMTNNAHQSLSGSYQSCIYTSSLSALCLLLRMFHCDSQSFFYHLAGKQIHNRSAVGSNSRISKFISQSFSKKFTNLIISMGHKNFFRLFPESCSPLHKSLVICMAADSRQTDDFSIYMDFLTKKFYICSSFY